MDLPPRVCLDLGRVWLTPAVARELAAWFAFQEGRRESFLLTDLPQALRDQWHFAPVLLAQQWRFDTDVLSLEARQPGGVWLDTLPLVLAHGVETQEEVDGWLLHEALQRRPPAAGA